MKCAMDFTKRSWAEAWTDLGNGPSVWLLPSGGQFYTRSCTRCARLLPYAGSNDPKSGGDQNDKNLRCVQCGEHIDAVILYNLGYQVANNPMRLDRHDRPKPSARTQEPQMLLNVA
jgi:hypothetical protein